MERLRAHDQGFVSVLPDRVYTLLAAPRTYPDWWPGAGVHTEGPVLPFGSRSLPAVPTRHREGIGLYLEFGTETLEWYLEPFHDGTIVNAFLDLAGTGRRSRRRLLRLRRQVHVGLAGLKRRLEEPS